jgi:hypothetical protein
MSQSTALITYNVTTDREDLTDLIAMISPEETPMFTRFKKTSASNTYHRQ